MTNKKRGVVLIAAGAALLLAALFLIFANFREADKADKTAANALQKLDEAIAAQQAQSESPAVPEAESAADSEPAEQEDAALEIDGQMYMGIIEIPKIGARLPVMREWSYDNLAAAPCRYSGSVAGRNIIIAGHNYKGFFSRLQELNSGDEIYLTTIDGVRHDYEVDYSVLVGGNDLPTMKSGSDSWDLTVFTCTWSGWSRVTVRAVLVN